MNVLILTPAYDGKVESNYTISLIETIKLCAANGVNVHPVILSGEAIIQRARNLLVKLAMELKPDCVVFIDSDQIWSQDDFLRIVKSDKKVIGVPVRLKHDMEQYNVKKDDLEIDISGDMASVDGIGTGFLKVDFDVLKKLWDTSEVINDGRNIFETKIIDGEFVSEDLVFCKKIKSLGYDINIDLNAKVGHVGSKIYYGSFRDWYKRVKG